MGPRKAARLVSIADVLCLIGGTKALLPCFDGVGNALAQ